MGSIQIKKMKSSNLPQVYEIHEKKFPNPAKARYYETLLYDTQSPCYVALNDGDEVIGYIATRFMGKGTNIYSANKEDLPHLIISSFATSPNEQEEKYESKTIKEHLMDALMVQVRIGGYAFIQGDLRASDEESIAVFTEYGFESIKFGKYKDGEEKVRMKYHFEIDRISQQFRIERATYSHLSRIQMLHNQYLNAQKNYSYFARMMRRKGSVLLVVLDEWGRVVGYLAARRQHQKTDDSNSPYTTLNFVSMAVDKSARGNKLGEALIDQMIYEAKDSDVEIIFGHVREGNEGARKLYRKLGFNEKKIGQYKDTDEDKYLIKKRIRFPSLKPYAYPTLKNGALVAFGYLLREFQKSDD